MKYALLLSVLCGLTVGGGCTPVQLNESVYYQGIKTVFLDGDLVNFHVKVSKGASARDVSAYAECAAAQYTLVRGYSFTRLVRVNIKKEDDHVAGDAIYVISQSLPNGSRKIDAEVTVAECARTGIPTV